MHRKESLAQLPHLTIDKVSTWNQGVIAYSFGTDTIIAYHDFKLEEAFGTHKRTGDGAFLAQCRKIENGEIWKKGENVYMQLRHLFGTRPLQTARRAEVRFSRPSRRR